MKTVPKLGLTILLAIGLMIGFTLATYTVVVKMIGDEAVQYKEQQ